MGQWQQYIIRTKVYEGLELFDRVNAFVVAEVYAHSLADEAGIKAGLYFVPMAKEDLKDNSSGGELGAAQELVATRFGQGEQDFTFFDLENKCRLVMTFKSYPFGMRLRKSVLGLCVDLEKGRRVNYEAAAEVVHEEDDQAFVRIAVAASQNHAVGFAASDGVGGLISLLNSPRSEIEKAASNDNQDERQDFRPEQFFMAAFLAFKGRADLAEQFLPDQHDYPAIYGFGGGVASLYYLAQGYIAEQKYAQEDRDVGEMEGVRADASDGFDAIFMFRRALELNPKSQRVADILERLTGARPAFQAFVPEPFYSAYEFLDHDPQRPGPVEVKPAISYEATLKGMKEGEYLLVILLGLYRANGFYSKAMMHLTQLYPLVGRYFPHIHVITAYNEMTPLKPHWLDGEAFALDSGLPVNILYDEDNEICEEMEVNASPHGLVIDHKGMIIHRGALDEEEGYWQAVALSAPKQEEASAKILSFPPGDGV